MYCIFSWNDIFLLHFFLLIKSRHSFHYYLFLEYKSLIFILCLAKLFGPIKVTTTEGKTSKLELDKLSYFDVSQLEGCFISPEESDFTRSDTYSTDDSSQDRKGATIESACIHSIKDLWNKIGITEIDAFASRDKGTRGLEKLAWLPDIGNKEISTYLITLKNDVRSIYCRSKQFSFSVTHSNALTWTAKMKDDNEM